MNELKEKEQKKLNNFIEKLQTLPEENLNIFDSYIPGDVEYEINRVAENQKNQMIEKNNKEIARAIQDGLYMDYFSIMIDGSEEEYNFGSKRITNEEVEIFSMHSDAYYNLKTTIQQGGINGKLGEFEFTINKCVFNELNKDDKRKIENTNKIIEHDRINDNNENYNQNIKQSVYEIETNKINNKLTNNPNSSESIINTATNEQLNVIFQEDVKTKKLLIKGCAGSGKTMVLFDYIISCYEKEENSPKFKIIVPENLNQDYKNIIKKNIVPNIGNDKVFLFTIEEFYACLIKEYGLKIESDKIKNSDSIPRQVDETIKHCVSQFFDKFSNENKEELNVLHINNLNNINSNNGYINIKNLEEKKNQANDKRLSTAAQSLINKLQINKIISFLNENQSEIKIEDKYNRNSLFYILLFCYYAFGRIKDEDVYCFDEIQNYCKYEISWIFKVIQGNYGPIFMGDVNQIVNINKDDSVITQLEGDKDMKKIVLSQNIRNSYPIVEYCNNNLGEKYYMEARRPKNEVNDKVDEYNNIIDFAFSSNINNNNEIKIICKYDNELFFALSQKFNVIDVKKCNGVQYDKVIVFDRGMTDNEKYIAYTRAVNKLIVVH